MKVCCVFKDIDRGLIRYVYIGNAVGWADLNGLGGSKLDAVVFREPEEMERIMAAVPRTVTSKFLYLTKEEFDLLRMEVAIADG